MGLRQLITELRRRRVFRSAGFYVVAAWVAVQVASLVFPAIDVPETALRYVWLTAISLFPLVLVFSWSYDVTLDGIRRTEPAAPDEDFDPSLRRTDMILIAALAIVAASLTLQFSTRIERDETGFDETIEEFSIAVLPFDDLSGNPDEQYFASGMQAALIGGLSRIRALRVTSKVSTLGFQGAGMMLEDVASQLRVARVIEGQVLRNEDQVSISVQLRDARIDRQLWSATFEDELANIMFLQNRMSQEIANQIRVSLEPAEQEAFRRAQAVDPEAYLAVLRGIFHVERFNPEDMAIAATHFQRAVELDPEYALGHWGLSKLCGFQAQAGLITPFEARERCIPPVERALELDPFLPEAYMSLAAISTWQLFDWDAGIRNFERAIELNPNYAEAHMFYSHYLGIIGELDKSTEHMRKAVELDPLNPFVRGLNSVQIMMQNDYEAAIAEAEFALGMAPGYAFGYVTLALAHDTLGNYDESVEALANMMRYVFGNAEAASMLESFYETLGYESGMIAMGDAMAEVSKNHHVPLVFISAFYEQGGDYDRAVEWLELAYELQDPDIPYIGVNIKDPELRAHPRFQALLLELELDYWVANP